MGDPKKKFPVKLGKVQVAKSSDPKLNKAATDALASAIEAVVNKSAVLETGNVTGKDKGFQIDITIHELTLDAKKDELFARIELQLDTLPGPKMFTNVAGKSKFSGLNAKKPEKDVADIMAEIMKKAGPDMRKALEGKIDSLGED